MTCKTKDPYIDTYTVTVQKNMNRRTFYTQHRITLPVDISRALELTAGDKLMIKLYINKEMVVSKV